MARTITHMSFEEFARDVEGVFNRVVRENETILIEKGEGEVVVLEVAPVGKPSTTGYEPKPKTEADRQAFLSSFGGWADVDLEEFLKRIYESRDMPPRNRVSL